MTPFETITDDDGFFEFDSLPPSQDYAIYTLLDQSLPGALPVSLVESPATGQLAELGEVETQLAGALTISVRTFDKSPLPSGGRVFVSLRLGWHPPRLDLPNNRSGQADVVLPAVAKEQLQISVRVPGFKVLRTLPRIQWDMNHSYPLRFEGATTLIIVLTPDN